ncbi:hypothetical protein [Erwinia aphidicola]|jgi:hypothetical protein|uniref:hypothetical protein n=1 Tax=Erwinia aphidicola TaxID=68334 RepID=UPI00300C4FB1
MDRQLDHTDNWTKYDNALRVKLSDTTYLSVEFHENCSTQKIADQLIKYLLSGTGNYATLVNGYMEYSHLFVCQDSGTVGGGRYFYYDYEPVSAPTDCKIDIPTNVEFGEVSMGNNGLQRRLEGSLSCDYKTLVGLSLTGTAISGSADNQQIKVGDAIVSYAFDNGKTTTYVSTEKDVKSSFNLNFMLKDTGKSAGNKQASVVMKANWW